MSRRWQDEGSALWRSVDLLLWPRICPLCDREIEPSPTARVRSIHRHCLGRLDGANRIDLRFARRHDGVPIHTWTSDTPDWFRVLHRLKYQGERGLIVELGNAVAETLVAPADPDRGPVVVVPLPDDPSRRRARGYSVVEGLAGVIARHRRWTFRPGLLLRARGAPSQTECRDDLRRAANVRGVFRPGDLASLASQTRLLLVDDQVTSGATVREALAMLGVRDHRLAVLGLAGAARTPVRVRA